MKAFLNRNFSSRSSQSSQTGSTRRSATDSGTPIPSSSTSASDFFNLGGLRRKLRNKAANSSIADMPRAQLPTSAASSSAAKPAPRPETMAAIETRLREAGCIGAHQVLEDVPRDGNCFFNALIRVAGQSLRDKLRRHGNTGSLTPQLVRKVLAQAVLDHFSKINSLPQAEREQLLQDDWLAGFLSAMTVGLEPSGSQHDEDFLLKSEEDQLAYMLLQPHQQAIVESLAQDRSWGGEAHTLTPAITAALLGMRIGVIPESADAQGRRTLMPLQHFPDDQGGAQLLYSRDIPGEHAHYMAVVNRPQTTEDPAAFADESHPTADRA